MHPLKNLTSFKCSIEEVECTKDTFGEGIGIYEQDLVLSGCGAKEEDYTHLNKKSLR